MAFGLTAATSSRARNSAMLSFTVVLFIQDTPRSLDQFSIVRASSSTKGRAGNSSKNLEGNCGIVQNTCHQCGIGITMIRKVPKHVRFPSRWLKHANQLRQDVFRRCLLFTGLQAVD